MKILLTNDDGIEGEGLIALALALKDRGHDFCAVVPSENNSGVSHHVTMRKGLTLSVRETAGRAGYVLGGTPVDCVLFALRHLQMKPELVLSGINDGMNLGSDCLYSGTVAAAAEGAQNGIPAIALSLRFFSRKTKTEREQAFASAAELICDNLAEWSALARQLSGPLNVNVPAVEKIAGFRFCPLARLHYRGGYERLENGTYRMAELPPESSSDEGTDEYFCARGYVTLTPLRLDNTDFASIARWESRT